MLELSSEQCRAWLAAISRADLTEEKLPNVYICGSHFVRGLLIFCMTMHSTGFYLGNWLHRFMPGFYLGEPSHIMSMSDVDWLPCLNLGHDKVSISSLQVANERTTHTELRQKRIEEASARTSRSVEIETLVNEETATIDSRSFCSQEVQTDSVLHDDKSANRG